MEQSICKGMKLLPKAVYLNKTHIALQFSNMNFEEFFALQDKIFFAKYPLCGNGLDKKTGDMYIYISTKEK